MRACSKATAASPAMCAASAAALQPTTLAPGPRGSGAAAALTAAAASDAAVVIARVDVGFDAPAERALSSAASASPSATRPGWGSAAAPAADPGG